MASEVGQRASKGRGRWRTEFPWHANPTTSCSRQAAAERVFISPPCFKERRDQRDLNKVGEQWLGDLRRAGAMPTSSRRGNSNRIVYDMHAPSNWESGLVPKRLSGSPACFQRPLHSTQPNDGTTGHYCCARGLGIFQGKCQWRNRIHSHLQ